MDSTSNIAVYGTLIRVRVDCRPVRSRVIVRSDYRPVRSDCRPVRSRVRSDVGRSDGRPVRSGNTGVCRYVRVLESWRGGQSR